MPGSANIMDAVIAPPNYEICRLPSPANEIASREIPANARLIAAAPEMYEALGRVVDLLNDPGVGDIEQWKRDCREWTAKSRAALAKADGRKP